MASLANGTTINGSTAWHAGNDGSGSGLDADKLDGIDSTQFLRSDALDYLQSTMVIDQNGNIGNIAYEVSGGCYIPRPLGGRYVTTTSAITGALAVKLPTASWNKDDMISFHVDIYDYAGDTAGESVTLHIYGYQTGAGSWANTGAVVESDRTDRNYSVRFGHDGTRHIVYIGETTSTWSYPQVNVREFQAGYSASFAVYDDAFAVTFETTLGTIIKTSTANYPVAQSANTLTTARTINGTSFNGSANITTANWGTARTINGVSVNGSTNYTLEPYVERDDATNAIRYLTFVDDATAAYKRLNMDTNLSYNPSTNLLATNISGNAATATTATNVNVTNDGVSAINYIPFVSSSTTGSKNLKVDGSLYYNPSSNALYAPYIYPTTGVLLSDADYIRFGSGADWYMQFNGTNLVLNENVGAAKLSITNTSDVETISLKPSTGEVTAAKFIGDGSQLTGISAGAAGGGNDAIFHLNGQVVTTSYSIPSGQNAMTAGDITINTGVTVTIPDGSRWVIV